MVDTIKMTKKEPVDAETFVKEGKEEISSALNDLRASTNSGLVDDILQKISAYSFKATHYSMQAAQSSNQKVVRFRDGELQIFIDELQFQFKIWSRIQAVRHDEIELARGQ